MPPGSTNEVSGCSSAFMRVDLALEPLDLGRSRPAAPWLVGIAAGPAQIGAEVEQVVLDPRQHRVRLVRRVQPGQPDRGVGLVDRAVGGDAGGVLGDPRAVAERGAALIAAAGVDLGTG